MNAPLISRPREPGLYRRSPGIERHIVRGGGFLLIELAAGDHLEIVDLEGLQACELLAFDAQGRDALGALGLQGSAASLFVAGQLQRPEYPFALARKRLQAHQVDVRHLPAAASLWGQQTPAGQRRRFVTDSALLLIAAAPGGPTPVDVQGAATDLALIIERARTPEIWVPPLPDPLADPIDEFVVRAGTAHSYTVRAGEYIQVLDVAGRQCSDFVALRLAELENGLELDLDQTATRTLNGSAYPAPGLFSKFFDRQMQPMLEVLRDTVGRHDSFSLACTARYYESQGYFGHDNCSDNLSRALAPYGVAPRSGWPAINFFFNTQVTAHQRIALDEPWSRPGDYVLMRATSDLVCASSACPDDIDPANGWDPTDIHIRVYGAKERFSIAMASRKTPDAEPQLTRESGFHPQLANLTRHFIDYRGYWLPSHYAGYGATEEYLACREQVAVMDLSALRKFDVLGPDAEALLQYCLTRDVTRLAVGQVVYSAMCYEHGGMLDDGTLLRLGPDTFRWVCGEDYAGVWLREQAQKLGMKVWVKSASEQVHNIAVQGPRARELLSQLIWTPATQPGIEELGWFRLLNGRLEGYDGCPLMVTRTGYTGELGYEIWCHPSDAAQLWQRVWETGQPLGLTPLGLDALDMLRIEAGLVFADHEFDDQTDPFEAGIGFCVPLKSKTCDFIGRDALLRRSEHPQHRLVGLELEGNEVAAHGDCVRVGRAQVGVVTSACRSPLLGKSIALCRIDIGHAELGTQVEVGKLDGQQKRIAATVTAPIFHDPTKSRVRA
ncbi:MAG: DUF1989 domain-containing protein [Pseudomonas sp.]|uniref:DUF1989 domain-containing protein n=1 Tax=Pseudomonas abieticivorans TaxID=2931382 RepID=UPI0020C0D558|nr:aminomethyltransferase family protein [Pseudomonas sp. PIA16]MDE1169109.1 DUF1989 domain-containing protein [Pseudomonas sp.]